VVYKNLNSICLTEPIFIQAEFVFLSGRVHPSHYLGFGPNNAITCPCVDMVHLCSISWFTDCLIKHVLYIECTWNWHKYITFVCCRLMWWVVLVALY